MLSIVLRDITNNFPEKEILKLGVEKRYFTIFDFEMAPNYDCASN